MKKLILALLAVLFSASAGASDPSARKPPLAERAPRVIAALQHDESPALRDMVPATSAPSGKTREKRRHLASRPRGNGAGRQLLPDPVVQTVPGTLGMPSPTRSFDGVPNVDGVLPPDPNGAVGPNHYVQWVNTSFAIYDKSGTLLYGPAPGNTLWAGFGGPCETDNEGDPIVLHDHLADRWLMSQLALPDFPFGPFYQCIAVSQTSDPTGAYHRYAFVVSDTKVNDYPKFGVWPDAYYLAVNQFNQVTLTAAGQGVLAFERDNMLAGLPARMVYLDLEPVDPNLGGMLPADMDGAPPPAGSPGYFVQFDDDAWGYAPVDQLQIWRFHVDWTDPQASTFTGPAVLPTAPFDSNMCGYNQSCIPQPGTRRKLDAIADRLMYRLQYRNFGTHETLVVNHTVDVGGDHAGIRWYEVRDPGGAPFIRQQGTYAPDANHRWMGSAALDAAGDLAIGYSVSGSSTFPSIRYAGRLADDPLDTLAQAETTLMNGSGSQTDQTSRWGDYSALSLDPTDQCTFWYTHEYYAVTSAIGWQTRIGSFRFPTCTSDLPAVIVVPTANATEAGTVPGAVTVRRTGSTAADLAVGYTVRGTATPGSDYVPLTGSVTIPAGSATATIPVIPLDDPLVEGDETVIVTLAVDPAYAAGTPSSAMVTIVSDDLPSDLVVAALAVPPAGGAGVAITVGDTTKNQGGGAAGASTTSFYLSADPTLDGGDRFLGSRAVPALAPAATNAGTTSLAIPAGTAAGAYWVIARADAGDAVVEGQEGNNTSAASIQLGPDLIVAALSVPPGAGMGATIVVTDTTKNQGGGPAGASSTAFYLSTNSTVDAGDVLLGRRAVPPLDLGAASSGTTALTIPAGAGPGSYWVIARADTDGAVAETQEANNTMAAPVQVGADLVIAAFTGPTTAGAGTTISVTDTTKNLAGGAAGASSTAFYLSADATFDAGDVLLGRRAVPALAPGASNTGSTPLTIPAGTAVGTYYVVARADADGVVAEIQEGNNTAAAGVQVGPDLTVTLSAPATAGAGATISATDTTRNQGGGSAAASSTAFYLSTDTTFDAGDVVLGRRAVPALAPGGSSAGATALAIPAGIAPGVYWIVARADADGAVAETFEANNTAAAPVQVGPDLIIAAVSVPATAAPGATISATDTTRNQGGGTAGASSTTFYLSTDATFDASDVPLGGRAVPALAPGGSSAGATALTIPTGAAPGTYWVIARADADGAVAETQEGNNPAAASLQLGPDLVVAGFSVPPAAGAGATIVVGDTTRNQGQGPAGASTTSFYLSADATFDAGDALLGSRAIPALAAGTTSTGSTSLTIPAGTAVGAYWIIARADANGVIVETQENNNAAAAAIQVGPDLVVAAFSVPPGAGAGATISVTDTTRNAGGGPAGTSGTAFYLSPNSTLDANDVLLGSRVVPALAAGATSTGSTALTIPAGTAIGTYWILARADADGVVAETQEGNNTAAAALQVGADLVIAALSVPSAAGAGATISVTDTTRNLGGGAADASATAFYLSTDPTLDAGDVLLGRRAVPALASGSTSTGSTLLTIPAGTGVGTYYVIARADADGVVPETQEGNNTAASSVQVGVDLVVPVFTVPTAAGAGATLAVSDTTRNQGEGTTAPSTTAFYLSTDPTLDAGDVLLGTRAIPALGPGATSTDSTTLTIPAGTAVGPYWIIARADADNVVAETQEGNNTSARQVQIGPDLIIASLSAPTAAAAGGTISVTDTTRNAAGGATAASSTAFYLSTNPILDASDVLLGGRAVPALAPGATSTGTTALTIPGGTTVGAWYVIARADADGVVAETQEGNNTAATSVLVGPDLVIAALTVPATAAAGATIAVTDTTTNQGQGAAGPSTTVFYLSTNAVLDAGDVQLGSRGIPALAAGATSTGADALTIPAGTAAGAYFVIGRADGTDVVVETLEGNNVSVRSIQVGAGG